VGPSAFHQDLAGIIQESLARCGLGVDVQTLSLADLYAPGPEGPLFGRNFDLALIAWAPMPSPDCGLYASWEIPVSGNGWIGTNIAGFSDAEYDQACTAAALALPDEYGALLARAEAAFVELLPAVPLFAPPSVEVVGSW
jgi:peptide/nickel transport system substrate-binding protein